MKDDRKKFSRDRILRVAKQGKNRLLKNIAFDFMVEATKSKYSYNFEWMGVPIIQYPEDIIAMQEIIWQVKPDLIIETGIARGGSMIFYASMLSLIGKGKVLGIDIDIRKHNRNSIENHTLGKLVTLIEGSSTSPEVLTEVKRQSSSAKKVLVILDSLHSTEHVTEELRLYAPLVTKGSYLIAFDTITDLLPSAIHEKGKPWNTNKGPGLAVKNFLKSNPNFISDKNIDDKLQISVAPRGYLKRIK